MSLWNEYPYSSMHEFNLDWIIKLMKELHADWDEFTALNKITNAGAWDITKQYQAWTVVSDNNVGYISFKPVPAGIAINNTEYWGLIADYNILITNLSSRISALENSVDNIDTVEIPGLQDQIDEINERLGNIRDQYIIFLTDSYGAVQNGDGNTYIDIIAAALGLSNDHFIHVSTAGAGFTQPHGDPKEFDYILMNSIPSAWRGKATKIFVFAGANDISVSDDVTAIHNGMNYFMYDVFDYFPNADVYIGCVGDEIDSFADMQYRQTQTIGAYRTCGQLGAHYITNSEYILSDNTFFASDGIHPNADGVNALGRALVGAVLDNICNISLSFSTNATVKTPDGVTHTETVYQSRDNNKVNMLSSRDTFSITSPAANITLNYNGVGSSLVLPRTIFRPEVRGGNPYYMKTGICVIYASASTVYTIPIIIWLTTLDVNGAVFAIKYLSNQTINGAYIYDYHFSLD